MAQGLSGMTKVKIVFIIGLKYYLPFPPLILSHMYSRISQRIHIPWDHNRFNAEADRIQLSSTEPVIKGICKNIKHCYSSY